MVESSRITGFGVIHLAQLKGKPTNHAQTLVAHSQWPKSPSQVGVEMLVADHPVLSLPDKPVDFHTSAKIFWNQVYHSGRAQGHAYAALDRPYEHFTLLTSFLRPAIASTLECKLAGTEVSFSPKSGVDLSQELSRLHLNLGLVFDAQLSRLAKKTGEFLASRVGSPLELIEIEQAAHVERSKEMHAKAVAKGMQFVVAGADHIAEMEELFGINTFYPHGHVQSALACRAREGIALNRKHADLLLAWEKHLFPGSAKFAKKN